MATIQGVYIALFGRPADPAGLAYFNAATGSGADLTAIGDLAATAEYQARFAGMTDTEVVNSIYQSLFERDAEPGGMEFFLAELAAGRLTINSIAIAILDGAQGDDLAMVNAKLAAAELFTSHLDLDTEIAAYAGGAAAAIGRGFIDDVESDDPATAAEADAAILLLFPDQGQGGGSPPGGSSGGGGANVAPVAVDDTRTIDEDTIVTISAGDLVANDTDADGDALSVTAVSNASNGSVTLSAGGEVTFTPTADFHGTASFDYEVSDGRGGADTGTVTLIYNPVNDAPDLIQEISVEENNAEIIVADFAVTDAEGDTVSFALAGPDAERFKIDDDGVLKLKEGVDYEALVGDKLLEVTVTASDGQQTTTRGHVVEIVDVTIYHNIVTTTNPVYDTTPINIWTNDSVLRINNANGVTLVEEDITTTYADDRAAVIAVDAIVLKGDSVGVVYFHKGGAVDALVGIAHGTDNVPDQYAYIHNVGLDGLEPDDFLFI